MFLLTHALTYIPYGLAASLLFLAARAVFLCIRGERASLFSIWATAALGLSLTAVFAVTVSPVCGYSLTAFGRAVNLVPLTVLATAWSNPVNLWGNILLFVPVGALLVLTAYRCRRLSVTLLMGAGLSLVIETLQLFCARGTDIDDVILNTAGTAIGFVAGRALLRKDPELAKKAGIVTGTRGGRYERRTGVKGPAVLAAFVLAAVFAAGFSLETPQIDPPPPVFVDDSPEPPAPAPVLSHVEITAKNAYLFEVGTDTVCYEKASDAPVAPASTAKMLTAITALDCCKEDDEVTVGKEVERISRDASRAWLSPGNRLTVRQLLCAMLLPSGNDAAYALAVHAGRRLLGDDGASIDAALEAFMASMNEKAAGLEAVSSHFVSPDGYDAPGQYTTAADLARIAEAFSGESVLMNIAGSYRSTEVWASGEDVTYYNTNELLDPGSPYYFEEATGLKTGKSGEAGCCLVSCADIRDRHYICVVMGSSEEGRWQDTLALYGALSDE